MTVLYIILGLIALLVLLMHITLGAVIEYDGSVDIRIRISLFNITLKKLTGFVSRLTRTGTRKKKPAKKKKAKAKKAKRMSKKPVPPPKKKSFSELLGFISRLSASAGQATGILLKKLRIRLYYFELKCASDEAMKTAEMYAAATGAVFSLLEVLSRFLRFRYDPDTVLIYPDYNSEKPQAALKVHILFRPIYIFPAAFAALKAFIKRKDKKK